MADPWLGLYRARSPNARIQPTPGAPHIDVISTRNNSTTMPGINDALEQIRKLKPDEKLVYTTIAKKHGVSRTTLSRAHRRVQVPQRVANHNQRKLSN